MRWDAQIRLALETAGLLRSQWWREDRIARWQDDSLVKLLRYAVTHVPFYESLKLKPGDVRSAADIERFPVVTKQILQEQPDRFLSRSFTRDALHHSKSSGSTGEPVTTWFDEPAWIKVKYAVKARRVLATTRGIRHRILLVSEVPHWPALPAFVRPIVDIRGLLVTADMQANVHMLAEFAPTVIYGFPSYIVALAEAAGQYGITLPAVPLVCTSSERLSDATRRRIEEGFRGRVTDVYGSTEFKEIAFQCEHHRYHVNFESVYVEARPHEAQGISRLLVTGLANRAMPLIRYELGDTGRVLSGSCACGRHGAFLTDLHGRLSEMLVFPDGTQVSPYAIETTLEGEPAVRYFRIVHEQPWVIRIEAVLQPTLSAEGRSRLESRCSQLLPEGATLRIVKLDEQVERNRKRAVIREF